jgi:hypothetical protein
MENKYYTPSIEEFHVGFLFETYVDRFDEWKQNSVHNIYDFQSVFNGSFNPRFIRVKYLNEQDIESLGFRQTQEIPHWFELKSKIQPGSYRLIYTYLEVGEEVLTGVSIIYFKGDYADPIVRGITIKNKSELKRLLAQLNIE